MPPRAATSCMFETVFSKIVSCGAMTMTGMDSSIKRDRSMLQFAGRIAFSVDVGDFLKLQRAFERHKRYTQVPRPR